MAYVVPPFINYNNCASATTGAKVIFATDDFFAAAENLLKDEEPIENDQYTEFGKWMDGWETRRRRENGHDWCLIQLAGDTVIKGFHVDTGFFTGNYPPRISILGFQLPKGACDHLAPRKPFTIGVKASMKEYGKCVRLLTGGGTMLVGMTELHPGAGPRRHHYYDFMDNEKTYSHVRINFLPDGGVARFKVYGEIRLNATKSILNGEIIDLIAMKNGGKCIGVSNAHYGHPRNLIKPEKPLSMADGWETARRLDRPAFIEIDANGVGNVPGKEWSMFKLALYSKIKHIEVDTTHFKGNAPNTIEIAGTETLEDKVDGDTRWIVILQNQKLQPDHLHKFKKEIIIDAPFNCVRITIAPDGGVARVRLFGYMYVDPLVN